MKRSSDNDIGRPLTRRNLMHLGISASALALAGCSQNGDDGTTTGSPTDGETATDAATDEETATDTTTAADQQDLASPVEPVPEDARCAVCNMYAAKHPDWNAQLTHENGDRKHFCSPGCLTTYHAVPSHFDEAHSQDDVAHAWARDYQSKEYVDATAADYVLDEDDAHIEAPMGKNPVPFADTADAQAYVDQYDSLTSNDVVPLSAFDVALARRFRARFLPETDETAIVEPVSVPEDAECAVCNMMPAKFPKWNSQLSHEDGSRKHFCSPGCLSAYSAKPEHFASEQSQDTVVGVWTRDVNSTELIDGTTASYVLETNGDRAMGPMKKMGNPLPYASEADAQAYVDQYDDLTSNDVVSLSAFDVATARKYRMKFLPKTEEKALIEPVSVPEDEECAVCNMMPAKFPEWNAQLSHEDGERAHFCSPGCLSAYAADPGHFSTGQTQDTIVGVWAHCVKSKAQIDGTTAYYVLETNADRAQGPMKMMGNPLPYSMESDAQAYVEQYDDLSADDIVRFQDFTREMAMQYRKKFL